MDLIPYIVAYAGVGIFLVAVIARVLMWLKMPIHMRWELYPVAHETRPNGGSYLEEVDWWKKPRHSSTAKELKEMAEEIFFLVALRKSNPKMWARSFPFHFGLYLVIAATVAMIGFGILFAISHSLMAGGFGDFVMWVVKLTAYAGLILSLIGAAGLLERRLNDPGLKMFTSPADIFNLVFFLVAFGLVLVNLLVNDRDLGKSTFFVYTLVTFKTSFAALIAADKLFVISVVLMAALVAYIPLTHMSHFIGKYFAYHAIRWNDSPNVPGSPHEAEIAEVLQYPVSWAADHIEGDGKKTWADIATHNPVAEEPSK